jgi:hypothetical protein
MANSKAKRAPSDQSAEDAPKVRQCLRCRATFHSAWAGERVCVHCKGTTAWKMGVPARSHPASKRR